jgi:DivIVA domain-containing protein
MADDVTPSQARVREFDLVRRGYDRAQVDAYLKEMSSRLEDLQAMAAEAKASALAVGIDDPEALANELGRIGGEVSAILEAARIAAEGLRKRASKDADKWRKEAESSSSTMLLEAIEQSQSMRAAAWKDGSAMLKAAASEAKATFASAQEDALFMRAEAERDALRLTSDARRDKEEALRAAGHEAESIIAEARAESDGVLAAAQKQAESAQERARALEDRRSELLSELEATRSSIAHLEEEIDSRRQKLEEPPEIVQPVQEDRTHHDLDVGSVKIVAHSKAVVLRPVDPDELVAEVQAMRTAADAEAARAAEVQTRTVTVIRPPENLDVVTPSPETAPAIPSVEQPAAEQQSADASVQTSEPAVPANLSAVPSGSSDEIGSLFARLRGDTAEQPLSPPISEAPVPQTPKAEPIVEPDEPEVTSPKPAMSTASEPLPGETAVAEDVATSQSLPAQNAALKAVKKSLVELQNETLEGLRTDDGWVPPSGFTDRFGEAFGALIDTKGEGSAKATADAFASDLEDAVTSAIEKARASGKGSRAVASDASKIFRKWRTDEAERRLMSIVG